MTDSRLMPGMSVHDRIAAGKVVVASMLASPALAIAPATLARMQAPDASGGEWLPGCDSRDYEVREGVAVLNIDGTLFTDAGWLGEVFGVWDYPAIADAVTRAGADPNVSAVVLRWNSPGGQAAGVGVAGRAIAGCPKPIVSFASGMMCSAAYWVGCAAPVVAGEDAPIGSIGAVMGRMDTSKALADEGIEVTWYTSQAPAKLDGIPSVPLGDAEDARNQASIDDYGRRFREWVATYRPLDEAAIIALAGEVRSNEAAVQAGLADEVGDLRAAMDKALAMVAGDDEGGVAPPDNNGAERRDREGSEMPEMTMRALAGALQFDISDETDERASKAVASLAANAAKAEQYARDLEMAKATINDLSGKVAAAVAERDALADRVSIFEQAAESAEWDAALASAGVKAEFRSAIKEQAKQGRTDGQSPADAVSAVKANPIFGAAFEAAAPVAPEPPKGVKPAAATRPADMVGASVDWIRNRSHASF